MNPPKTQPVADQPTAYFDPEAADMSEQEFAASLEAVERASFVVDEHEESIESSPSPGDEGSSSELRDPKLGSEAPPAEAGALAEECLAESEPSSCDRGSDWREQVSAKVNKYKSRTRHQVRYPSLQLQFEQNSYRSQPEGKSLSFSQSVAAEIVALQPTPVPGPEPRILLETTARVLEFPRPEPPPVDPNQLAEPVLDRPRIVEAPELLPAPPAMGGILIESHRDPEPERRPGFDVPLQSSPLGRRVWAGTVDFLLIAIAVAAFGYIFLRINSVIPPWQKQAQFAATLLAMLWPAYQYAFLVFSGNTPGLRLAKLKIQRFDGTPAPRSLRRWRVLASFLSAASLGLGYAWCFLDEDQLSWHDRITHTHLAPAKPA
jgi:uncharacterized RDD family membrane protein YckC